ncbi:uncharacterized protein EV422DRAFT_373208 [Fimicolochytrium jonesii]|uniref:uncharacterized protein n=1 Tax=Fimicolochytrium jonesii TaxID=1396493 RepID=UPI0022FF0451|nr:uncharacterized protein EV422DRAFT_373208 [Fimicolochytrium jonesii]KAI8815559.1 hypothetical protein EV422DRAFT_373208 [Fimicolochytrium jonesii]
MDNYEMEYWTPKLEQKLEQQDQQRRDEKRRMIHENKQATAARAAGLTHKEKLKRHEKEQTEEDGEYDPRFPRAQPRPSATSTASMPAAGTAGLPSGKLNLNARFQKYWASKEAAEKALEAEEAPARQEAEEAEEAERAEAGRAEAKEAPSMELSQTAGEKKRIDLAEYRMQKAERAKRTSLGSTIAS